MAKRERTEFEQARRKRAQKRLLRRLGILAVIGAGGALALAAAVPTALYQGKALALGRRARIEES